MDTLQTIQSAVAGSFGFLAGLALIGLLTLQEFVQSSHGPRSLVALRLLWCAIVPLGLVFGLALAVRLTEVL